jgi:riboflavin transporter FmnP
VGLSWLTLLKLMVGVALEVVDVLVLVLVPAPAIVVLLALEPQAAITILSAKRRKIAPYLKESEMGDTFFGCFIINFFCIKIYYHPHIKLTILMNSIAHHTLGVIYL